MIGQLVFDSHGLTRVIAAKSNGVKPVFRVTLADGNFIEATADHLVLTRTGRVKTSIWKRVDELVAGDRVVEKTRTTILKRSASFADVAEASLAGWVQGDGFVGQYNHGTNRSLTLEAMAVNDDEREHMRAGSDLVLATCHYREATGRTPSGAVLVTRRRYYGEVLRPFIERYQLDRRSDSLRVPKLVMRLGREAVCEYLRSLFQADGCVTARGKVEFGTVSRAFADDISAILRNLGISHAVHTYGPYDGIRKPFTKIIIGLHHARQRFAEQIGFVDRAKTDRLFETFLRRGKEARPERLPRIVSIQALGPMPVYDIQTESGTFLTRNLVVHNCFILGIEDDLVNEGGIFDGVIREARIFKGGSGSGANFSKLRAAGEKLTGGGTSSGLMSFLKVFDRAAGAIKSGGTTRRAAKMVVLNADHPDIEEFVNLESARGAQGRRSCDRLARLRAPAQCDYRCGTRYARSRARAARPCFERTPASGDSRSDRRRRSVRSRAERPRLRTPGVHTARSRAVRYELGFRSIYYGFGTEFKQLGSFDERLL